MKTKPAPSDLVFDEDETVEAEIARARKRQRGTPPTPRQWAAALTMTRGLKWRAASILGSDARLLDRAAAELPELAELHTALRERLLDDAEETLASKAIDDRDGESLRYLLRTIGRSRGYGDKVEHDLNVSDGAAVLAKLKEKLGVKD